MYKILNSNGLGVAGKQNELIELALTHGFNGVEVDMVDLVGRHDTLGKQFACQFLQSAKIDMGTFNLPIDLGASDEDYAAATASLDTILDLATTLNAKGCCIDIAPSNGLFSFQECFEKHSQRLQELSEKFTESNVKIGLGLRPSEGETADGEFKFINTSEELLKLVQSVNLPNVGICLDALKWVNGGGNVEQLAEAGIGKVVTEVRLADVAEGDDPTARTKLPGDTPNSFSVKLCKAIIDSGVELPVSVGTDLSTFARGNRDSIVGSISKQLDQLISGEDPAELALAAEKAAAEEAAGEGEEAAADGEAAPAAETPVAAAVAE